jgi:hypothetical protein
MLMLFAWVWICAVTGFLAFDRHAYGKASIASQVPTALRHLRLGASSAALAAGVMLLLLGAALTGTYILFRILVWLLSAIFG